MAKQIIAETEAWCPKKCEYFELSKDCFYANDKLVDTYYYCENLELCKHAVKAHEEFEKRREDIWKAVLNPTLSKEVDNGRGNEG